MSALSENLHRLIISGTLDTESAQQVEQYQARTGLGLAESLSAMGIAVSSAAALDPRPAPTANSIAQSQVELDPALSFDTFLRGPKNELALSIARSLSMQDRPLFPLCLIHAPMGMGKTHLMSAIALGTANRSRLFFHASDLGLEWQNAYARGDEKIFRSTLCEPELLLLDDLDWCRHSQSFQQEMAMVLEHRWMRKKCTLLSASMVADRIPGLDEALYSMLDGAVTCTLSMGDLDFRRRFLLSLPLGQQIPTKVIDYLAEAITDNFRRLKQAVAQLHMISDFTRVPLTVEVARAVVPMPEDLAMDPRIKAESELIARRKQKAAQLREMLREAETMEEQCLALQITISESIQLLRTENAQHPQLALLEKALVMVQNNEFESALKTCAGFFTPHQPASEDAMKKE